jgi:hypothetical protein
MIGSENVKPAKAAAPGPFFSKAESPPRVRREWER